MDDSADPDVDPTGAEASKDLTASAAEMPAEGKPVEDGPAAGEGWSPSLALDGFSGKLERLLALARAQKIDLSEISLAALVDQLAAALQQAPAEIPLTQKGDWVVMATWLVQLRSLLLLPADAPAQQDAAAEADQLHGRLVALQEMQALAVWLNRQPQLGHDVFARGQPEVVGISIETAPAIDVIEFLWASLALFDDGPDPDTANVYRPRPLDLYTVADARDRILRQLAVASGGATLDQLLPDPPHPAGREAQPPLQRRSAWSSTLVASLELARQGEVMVEQAGDFQPIHVTPRAGP
jgi:segregation and condensation protein A